MENNKNRKSRKSSIQGLRKSRQLRFRRSLVASLVLTLFFVLIRGQISDTSKPEKTIPKSKDNVSIKIKTELSSIEDWNLVLVNGTQLLADKYVPELETADSRGHYFDKRAVDELKKMLSDAKDAGLSPIICSSYRTWEKQTTLFNNQVKKLKRKGLSQEDAIEKTKTEIAYPGTSEHQLGLAVDIVALDYQLLDAKQADTEEAKWLREHCAEYGFILRYQEDKSEITGVIYEPWHFRYVGKEAAKIIMDKGICLEEYLEQ